MMNIDDECRSKPTHGNFMDYFKLDNIDDVQMGQLHKTTSSQTKKFLMNVHVIGLWTIHQHLSI